MAKEETPVALCDSSAVPPESGHAAGSRTAAGKPTLLLRMFQCAAMILIGVLLACCIIRSAAPDVTHARKGVLPGSLVVWAVVPLGIYACFIWNIFRVSKIKEKD